MAMAGDHDQWITQNTIHTFAIATTSSSFTRPHSHPRNQSHIAPYFVNPIALLPENFHNRSSEQQAESLAMACAMSSGLVMKAGASSLASSQSAISGASVTVAAPRVAPVAARSFVVKASSSSKGEEVSRRMALALVAGVVAAGSRIAPANAAYGESGESEFPFRFCSVLGFVEFGGSCMVALVAGVVSAMSRIAPANAAYGESGETEFAFRFRSVLGFVEFGGSCGWVWSL